MIMHNKKQYSFYNQQNIIEQEDHSWASGDLAAQVWNASKQKWQYIDTTTKPYVSYNQINYHELHIHKN